MSFTKKRGRVWWYYWRDENGMQKAKSLKTPSSDVAEVKKGEEDKKRHFGNAGLPFKKILWDTAKKDFLEGYKDGKTKEGHERSLSLFESHVQPVRVSDADYKKAKSFRDWLQTTPSRFGRPFSPTSVNIHVRNLHAFFEECKRHKYVIENPFGDVKQIPETKRAHKYLTKAEVQAVLAEARESWAEEKVLMLLFFLYTGVRLGEMANMKWKAIDLERNLFYLRGSENWEPKDREEHSIGIHPELLEGLKRHPRTSEFVFPGVNGGKRCEYSTRRLFNRLYKRAGITSFDGIHLLRHTFGTHFKGELKTLQKIFGHSDIKTTMKYVHVTEEDMQAITRISYA